MERVHSISVEKENGIDECRAANASDFIVSLPILRPSLWLYDCNGKSHDFYARRLSYLLRCINGCLI